MSFRLEKYAEVRPVLYHLTARQNIEHILALGRLLSAEVLSRTADQEVDLRTPRDHTTPVSADSYVAFIGDQVPLHAGNIEFEGGWVLEDLVEDLNRRVFFWSGWERGPIRHGANHFERYRAERPAVLRVRFDSLREHNPGTTPLFCRFNSGAPRRYQGRPSPRGPRTFLPACDCPYTPGSVVEVTFLENVKLPPDSEVSGRPNGGWQPLYTDH